MTFEKRLARRLKKIAPSLRGGPYVSPAEDGERSNMAPAASDTSAAKRDQTQTPRPARRAARKS